MHKSEVNINHNLIAVSQMASQNKLEPQITILSLNALAEKRNALRRESNFMTQDFNSTHNSQDENNIQISQEVTFNWNISHLQSHIGALVDHRSERERLVLEEANKTLQKSKKLMLTRLEMNYLRAGKSMK